MPLVLPLRKDLIAYLKIHQLEKKWEKALFFFTKNPRYPSLHTELLVPKENLIYSFRIDQKYRALFFIHKNNSVEVIAFTNHYR